MCARWRVLYGILVFGSMIFGIVLPGESQAGPPISLDDAISAAQKHHPLMERAASIEEQQHGAVQEAKAALYPSISLAEDVLYSNDPVFAFGSKLRQGRFTSGDFALDALNHPAPLSNFSASATGSWTIFDGKSARHKVEGAKISLSAAQLSNRYTAEQLAAQIATLYYRVLTAEDQVLVAERAFKRTAEIDESTGDRVRSGMSLESDKGRTHLAFRNADDDLASAKRNVTLARHDLFAAIGEPVSERPLIRPDISTTANSTAGDLNRRFDLQALRSEEQAARQNLSAIKSGAWPQVIAFGHVENNAERVVTNGNGNWTIGAKIQFNLLDGGLRKARVQEAEARIHTLRAQEKSTLLEADSAIEGFKNQIDDLYRRLTTADEAVRVHQETLQTSRERYMAGLVTITDVLDSEAELANAEFIRVRTYYQLCTSSANLALLSGNVVTPKIGRP